MYSLHSSNRKARAAYLRSLLGVLDPQQHEARGAKGMLHELRLCEWMCHALANMSYDKEADVLTLVHHTNRMLSLCAESRYEPLVRKMSLPRMKPLCSPLSPTLTLTLA